MRGAIDYQYSWKFNLCYCDVINADGGTRTASINGGFLALAMALKRLPDLIIDKITVAISVGKVNGQIVDDLDYEMD